MWTPSHVLVTVTKARNLLEKGKGGNDAYCIIGLGKEKFLTSVKPKTTNPTWDEQAEFELAEREDLKITVYHKSSIIDEFLGRAVINISELAHENINTHTQWYKLMSKPDKDHKKAEKDRGEIEIRVDFLVKPKLNSRTTGSVFDLSTKTKDKSLSLKNLKDKSLNIKHTIGDKLKTLNRKKSKFAGENQLAEQARRMGGSKLDFLEGEDVASLTSSYSSLNGPTLTRINDIKHANSFSRYSQKSAFISETSSINESPIVDNIKSPLPPSPLTKSSTPQVLIQQQVPITKNCESPKDNGQIIIKKTRSPSSSSTSSSSDSESRNMDKSNIPIKQQASSPQQPIQHQPQITTTIIRTQEHHEPLEQQSVIKSSPSESFASIFQASLPETPSLSQKRNAPLPPLQIVASNTSTTAILTTSNLKHRESTSSRTTMRKLENSFNTNDDDDDNDWASSDEEIVKQEIETFQRNQVMRQSERRKVVPTEDLTSDLINSNQVQKPTIITTSFDRGQSARRSNLQFNFSPKTTSTQKLQHTQSINSNKTNSESEDDIKTPDIDMDSVFQEHAQNLNKKNSDSKGNRNEALPDIINQNKGKHDNKSNDKAKKYFESFDGVSFNDITVPDSLRKELEYFDREELLQLIAYQKKYLDYKESRIKDLDNYIDNLVLKVIETQPGLLMQASGGISMLSRNKK